MVENHNNVESMIVESNEVEVSSPSSQIDQRVQFLSFALRILIQLMAFVVNFFLDSVLYLLHFEKITLHTPFLILDHMLVVVAETVIQYMSSKIELFWWFELVYELKIAVAQWEYSVLVEANLVEVIFELDLFYSEKKCQLD